MATAPDNDPQQQRKQDDKILRTRAVVGTKEQRSAFKERRREIQRGRALEQMTPVQQEAFKAREVRKQEAQAALQKRQQDDKILRTKGVVGDKAKRQQFRSDKARVQRERALERMTPEQRERALAQEAAAKGQKAAQQKRKQDDKILRTKSIVGDKAARDQFKADKASIQRERALERMTPEQREQALANEKAAQERSEAEKKQKEEDKLKRQVAKVGSKEEREKWRKEKEAAEEAEMLKKMTPEEQAAYQEQKRQREEAEAQRKAAEEKARINRQVAKVGSKEERQEWRDKKQKAATPTPDAQSNAGQVAEASTAAQPSTNTPTAPRSAAPVAESTATRGAVAAAGADLAAVSQMIQSLSN